MGKILPPSMETSIHEGTVNQNVSSGKMGKRAMPEEKFDFDIGMFKDQ